MIETRFALPVRSPMPFIVPWTCVRARLDGGQRVGHAALGVVVAVDADARRRRRAARDHGGRRRRRSARAATSRWCRTATTRSAPAPAAARRQASA